MRFSTRKKPELLLYEILVLNGIRFIIHAYDAIEHPNCDKNGILLFFVYRPLISLVGRYFFVNSSLP